MVSYSYNFYLLYECTGRIWNFVSSVIFLRRKISICRCYLRHVQVHSVTYIRSLFCGVILRLGICLRYFILYGSAVVPKMAVVGYISTVEYSDRNIYEGS